MTSEPGASIYVTAAEVEALGDAWGILTALHEASDGGAELEAALSAVRSVVQKSWKAQGASKRRAVVRAALRVAAELD